MGQPQSPMVLVRRFFAFYRSGSVLFVLSFVTLCVPCIHDDVVHDMLSHYFLLHCILWQCYLPHWLIFRGHLSGAGPVLCAITSLVRGFVHFAFRQFCVLNDVIFSVLFRSISIYSWIYLKIQFVALEISYERNFRILLNLDFMYISFCADSEVVCTLSFSTLLGSMFSFKLCRILLCSSGLTFPESP